MPKRKTTPRKVERIIDYGKFGGKWQVRTIEDRKFKTKKDAIAYVKKHKR